LLEFACRNSLEEAGSGPSLSSWVAATFPSDVDDGIIRQMQDFDSGATFTLRLGFENDREPLLNRIHHLLWHEAEVQIQRKLLSEISAPTWDDFCGLLEERSGSPGALAGLPEELRERIQQQFNRLRTRTDTERIIHRLATLGAVGACTVHQGARKFSLTMTVRSESEYREALENYMRVYLPEEQVRREIDTLSSCPGETVLEHCLYFLVDFNARNIHHQLALRVREMDTACRTGSADGPEAFRRFVDLTLRAKYARSTGLPDAMKAVPFDRFAFCRRFMTLLEEDESGSVLGNAHHLVASTEELLRVHGDEPALGALNAFAQMLCAPEAREVRSMQVRFIDYVALCAGAQQYDAEQYREAIAPWMQIFRRYFSQELTQSLREALEAAADRIPRDTVAVQHSPKGAPSPPENALPDISAARGPRARTPSPVRDETEVLRPSSSTTPETSPPPVRDTAPRQAAAHDTAARAAATHDTAVRAAATHDTAARKAAGAPLRSEDSEEEILRKMEEEIDARAGQRSPSEAKPADESASAASSRGSERKPVKRSRTDEDIDSLLTEIENTLAPASASPRRVPAQRVLPAEADPMITTHLTWLRTFNSTFLNAYESRNARLAAGTRKRA
ncbi:MAG: hypothetical protein RRA94_08975, partial [Bacteroidota bacterium]|nr:hypothetical protein [Bacteroidota bacterium]